MAAAGADATTAGRRRTWAAPRIVAGNLAGAGFAAYLLLPNVRFFLYTHEPIGLVFAIQQAWVGAVFLLRRAPQRVSRHPFDWPVAYAAWLISFLVRPGGDHPAWAATLGLSVQIAGLALWAWAFAYLARSYGIVPADRGLVTRGPYALVRHPLYAAYAIGGVGYLMQSFSGWNVLVDATAVGLQLIRIAREERHLDNRAYAAYRGRVRWRLLPHVW